MRQQPALHENIQNLIAFAAAVAGHQSERAAELWRQLEADGVPVYQLKQALEIVRHEQIAAQQRVTAQLDDLPDVSTPVRLEANDAGVSAAHCDCDDDVTTPGGCCCG